MLGFNNFVGFIPLSRKVNACRVTISLLVLILNSTSWGVSVSQAQQTSIQGIITDAVTGQPLKGANILLQNLSDEASKGAATDANGFYQIGNIAGGNYYFRITFVGYRSYEDTLSFSGGRQETMSIGLQPDQEMLREVVVAASGSAAQIEAGRQQIYTSDLGRVPTPAGNGDLASYLQSLPGVVATGDRGGQLYVRGGTPSQNMVLVDGTLIYQPFHILGFFSAFPEDLIASTDFYAGGFGPEYSGRISSVIDVNMRDGNRNEAGGSASISPFLGEVIAEGPLRKGKSSWIASLRGSLIEQTSPALLGEKQPLRFDSQYLKMSFFGKGNSRCSMMGMRTFDRGRLSAQESQIFRWSNFVAGGRCVVLPGGRTCFLI